MEQSRNRHDVQKRLQEAVRAVAAQKPSVDAAAVRAMLVRELNLRCIQDVPDEEVRIAAEQIAAARTLPGRLHLLERLWEDARDIRQLLKNSAGPEWLRPPAGRKLDGSVSVAVEIDASATRFLVRAFEALFAEEPNEDNEAFVRLWIASDAISDAGGSIVLHAGDRRVGRLMVNPGLAQALEARHRRGEVLQLEGFLTKDSDGLSLFVNVPSP
jgi:hypothetical protein